MKRRYVIYCIIAGIVLFGTGNVMATEVSIVQPTTDVWVGDTFTVEIRCEATQDIKAWEMQLFFDNAKVNALEIEEGTIFTNAGFDTFFNQGNIDNSNGQILNMYDLILGPGTVMTTDSLVYVTFEALDVGTADLSLQEVGVTNETEYIPIEISNLPIIIHSIYDINGDMTVSVLDLTLVSNHYWETGSPGWIPEDVNDDGKIKVLDLALVSNEM